MFGIKLSAFEHYYFCSWLFKSFGLNQTLIRIYFLLAGKYGKKNYYDNYLTKCKENIRFPAKKMHLKVNNSPS